MARKPRGQYPGAVYHVMSRGNRRERIFVDDQDRRKFLQTLNEVCQKTGWQVHAYCLMDNHFHAAVEAPEPNLHGIVGGASLRGLVYIKEPQLLPTSVLNHGQMRELLSSIQTSDPEAYRNRAMLELLYSAGLRAGELLGLNVGDVDLASGTAIVLGKGNKQRVVPVGRTARRVLESYLRGVRPFLMREPGEQALFLTRAGQRMPYHAFWRMVHHYIAKAELPGQVSPHTFRRSCTTELIRGGANIYHVKELLGHESLDTLKHYAKLNIQDLKETHRKCHPRERDER